MNRFLAPMMVSLLAACGSSPRRAPPPPAANSRPTLIVVDTGHELAMLATTCWFGGTGADKASSDQNCAEVVRRVYGADDKTRLDKLRVYDETAVSDVAAKVAAKASADPKEAPDKDAIVAVLRAFAAAQRELMLASRAADRVKRDLKLPEGDEEKEKLSADEAAAIAPLKKIDALAALLALDAGPLKTDAHTLALMVSLERIRVTYTLPTHVKMFACSGPIALLFGVQPPAIPEEADTPLPPGTWSKYMAAVAKGAGHPVPDSVKTAADRVGLAWSGIDLGLAEKLRADEARLSVSGQLVRLERPMASRLEKESKALEAKFTPKN